MSIVLTLIVWTYLAEYPSRFLASALVFAGGASISLVLGVAIARARSAKWGIAAVIVVLALLAMVPVSHLIGRVTYACFGLTVYGIIPVPVLDITVDAAGRLWFRNKTHLITAAEIEQLATDGVEVVVVGIGWQSVAKVEERAFRLPRVSVLALSTPEALEEYARLKASGTKVVLLAHTTC